MAITTNWMGAKSAQEKKPMTRHTRGPKVTEEGLALAGVTSYLQSNSESRVDLRLVDRKKYCCRSDIFLAKQ